MTLSDYQRLCAALDAMLLRPPVTETRIAISILHMIRNHPVFTDLYAPLFATDNGHEGWRARMARGRAYAIAAAHMVRVAVNRWSARTPPAPEGPCDVLLVSYLFSPPLADSPDDMYFGRLAGALEERGRSVVVARFDATPGLVDRNRRRLAGATPHLFSRYLPVSVEWRYWRQLHRESMMMRAEQPSADDPVAARLPEFVSTHALSMWSLLNLRRAHMVADLAARLKPRVLVTTYEGLPWERMAYARARAAVPGLICAGYQQAPLFRHQYAIGRALGDPWDPDVIFTSSAHAARQLRSTNTYQSARIEVPGSKRHQSAVPHGSTETARTSRGVLVVPEGILGECVRLFGFAVRAARHLPGQTFYLRLHPNMTFAQLHRSVPALLHSRPSNIVLSDVDFATDVARSDVALYRASSAVVNCVTAGLAPVFLDDGDTDDIGPLYEVSDAITRVRTPENFVALLKNGVHLHARVQAFAGAYYDPLDPARLDALLELDPPR